MIIVATLVAGAIYFVFMTDRAVAPNPEIGYSSPEPSVTQTESYQSETAKQIEAAVLMYHHIGPLPEKADDIRKGLTVSSEEFDTQIKYLSEKKYRFITLFELEKAIKAKKVPDKALVLTFDDGYSDNYSQALPILKKYNAVGTFFIITSKMDTGEYMTKDQVRELYKAGNEIGSHTLTHPSLDKLKGSALAKELSQSKTEIETLTGNPVVSLCYPSGKYNDETVKAATDAGYKIAVTTHASTGTVSPDRLLEIYRYRISSSMSFAALFR